MSVMDTQEFPKREMAPPSYRLKFGKQTPAQVFSGDFAKYLQDIAEFEGGAREHVYDNAEANQADFRLHCFWLSSLICDGQFLLHQLYENRIAPEFPHEFEILNQKIDEFVARLYDWHGPAGSHADEPPSLKQSMIEANKGETQDFDL